MGDKWRTPKICAKGPALGIAAAVAAGVAAAVDFAFFAAMTCQTNSLHAL
jgi:hypothetical protein